MIKMVDVLKKLIVIGFLCCYNFGTSQDLVGIQNQTIAVTPGYTVANSTQIVVTGNVINNGTTTLTGNISVVLAIDSAISGPPVYKIKDIGNYPVVGFLPGAIEAFTLTTMASGTNDFKIDGNGTTVVVWPVFESDLATTDSVFTTVTILAPTTINELTKLRDIIIPNPLTTNIVLIYDDAIYGTPELLNTQGVLMSSVIHNKKLSIDGLAKGLYYIRFYNKVLDKYSSQKLILN